MTDRPSLLGRYHRQESLLVALGGILNVLSGLFDLLTNLFDGLINLLAGTFCRTFLLLATGKRHEQYPDNQGDNEHLRECVHAGHIPLLSVYSN